MLANGLKNIFLKGKYADAIVLTAAVSVILGLILSLTYIFPPAGLLLVIALFYSLKYLWLYDGVTFRWKHMKAPEKAGTVTALLGIGAGLAYSLWFRRAAFILIPWLALPLGVVAAFLIFVWTHPERRISLEDFFIAGWSAGSLGAISTMLLDLVALGLRYPERPSIIFSFIFFITTLFAALHLILTLGTSLMVGYARKYLGWMGMATFGLGILGLYIYLYISQILPFK